MKNRKRIRVVSRGCRFICSWGIFLTLISLLLLPLFIFLGVESPEFSPGVALSIFTLFSAGGVSLYALFKFRGLLKLYEREVFYSKNNVSCFRGMGWALIAFNVIGLIGGIVSRWMPDSMGALDLTVTGPENALDFVLGLPSSFDFMLAGTVLLVISWAIENGRQIKEEQEQFV